MAQLSEPARHIREQAEKAKDDGLTEEDFFREFGARVLARTPKREIPAAKRFTR